MYKRQLYPDAKTAVEMKAPAMKLTMVIESAPDHGFVPNLIPLLASKSLAEILEEPFVAPLLPPLPVSYTHLDVYKRQAPPSVPAAHPVNSKTYPFFRLVAKGLAIDWASARSEREQV